MNKIFFFLILFIINLNYFKCNNITVINEESIYNYFLNLLKGLSISEERECVKNYLENKEDILILMKDFYKEFKKGKGVLNIVIPYTMKLLGIGDLVSKCNVLTILDQYNKITSNDGIKEIGYSIYINADYIYQLSLKLRNIKGFENKLIFLGKILSIILNIYVY